MSDVDEEIPLFDPTKKKKRKKRTPAANKETTENDSVVPQTTEDDEEEIATFDFSKKKKKKKRAPTTASNEDDESTFDLSRKKKRKPRKAEGTEAPVPDPTEEKPTTSWETSDRDYTYGELLDRIFEILEENNPTLVNSKKRKMVMKVPTVFREGTKKTVWDNFPVICECMNRTTDHVLAYTLSELGTSGNLDGNLRLVIKGRFNPRQVETVIRKYISEYVKCKTCKATDTTLVKENRLYFVNCLTCGSTRSVTAIKQGFQAQVGKRRKR